MDYEDCVRFANECAIAFVATTDCGLPRVRPLALQFADEGGFYFQTEPVKAVYRQLQANRQVELCFYSPKGNGLGTVMRVSGEIEFVQDLELKAKLLKEQPFLESLGIRQADDPLFVLFRLRRGEAFFWTMANNMKEAEIEKILFDCP
jgi:pyridoxamine 5'-phosphate oxidase